MRNHIPNFAPNEMSDSDRRSLEVKKKKKQPRRNSSTFEQRRGMIFVFVVKLS